MYNYPRLLSVVIGPKRSYRAEHILSCLETHLESWTEDWEMEFMIQPDLLLPNTPAIAGNWHEWAVTNYAHLFWVISTLRRRRGEVELRG